MSILKSDRNPR